MQETHEIHWKADKRILHYVQGTKHFGIHYAASSPLELVGFSDSDWDGDPKDINSTSGFVFMLVYGPIFCSSNKQHTIYLSSANAEYRGAVNASTQCVWLKAFFRSLMLHLIHPLSFGVTIKVKSIFIQI